MVLADLVRSTLEGFILACCDGAEGLMDCVDTRTDGRRIFKVKDSLTVRTRESEQHIAQLCSSSVIGEKMKISSAALCLTEAYSEYLVETASVFAELLGERAAFSQSDLELVHVQLLKAVQSQGKEENANRVVNGMCQGSWKLPGERILVLPAWMPRHATWSMLRFQVKSESRSSLCECFGEPSDPGQD